MTPAPSQSPKILQFRQLRTAVALLLAAGLIFGYYLYSKAAASDSSTANTKEMILALSNDGQDSHAVLIKPDGTVIQAPDSKAGTDDREAVWRPDGNRILLSRAVSTSKENEETTYQIYRWNPENSNLQRRTIGTRALAHPRFLSGDSAGEKATALATAGGRVLLFDPSQDSSIHQILPPANKDADINQTSGDEEDSGGDFDAMYKGLGTSFREAEWTVDKTYIVAVMRRESGEALIVQKAQPENDGEKLPHLIVCAEHIDFDIDSKTNVIVFTALNYQWQDPTHIPDQFKLNGKVTRPYNHIIAAVDIDKMVAKDPHALVGIDVSKDDSRGFTQPAISPDGKIVMAVMGTYKTGTFESQGIVAYQLQGGRPSLVVQGSVSDPTWHPSGNKIAFVKRGQDGKHEIFVAENGSKPQSLTAGKGDFTHPLFSPQQ